MARFRLRKSVGGSTVRGGDGIQGAAAAGGDVDLAGSGHAAADASAGLTVGVFLSGHGDAASDGSADLGLTGQAPLSGSGHAAADGSGDADLQVGLSGEGDVAADGSGDLEVGIFLQGSGHAAADGSGDMDLIFVLSFDVDLPTFQFEALLTHTVIELVGGLVGPNTSAFTTQATSSGTTSGSYAPYSFVSRIHEPALYYPFHFGHKRHVIDGGSTEGKVLNQIVEEE